MAMPPHQALFGYRDGHRLLAASTELAADDRRFLGRHTDDPDAARLRGWESLIAGYPLPSGRYAITMVWPAQEMPRPGCVWAHVILLDELGQQPSPSALLLAFRRPQGPAPELKQYENGVNIPVWNSGAGSDAQLRPWLTAVMWAYFEPPVRSVHVIASGLSDKERHIVQLEVWSRGWKALRFHSTFADAPTIGRTLGERPVDLQLHETSRVSVDLEGARVLRRPPEAKPPDWAARLATGNPAEDPLQVFLETFGSDLDLDRSAVRSLVLLFLELDSLRSSSGSTFRIVDGLGRMFPSPAQGRRLKRAILFGESSDGLSYSLERKDLFESLVLSPHFAAFEDGEIFVREVALSLLKNDSSTLLKLIQRIDDASHPGVTSLLSLLAAHVDHKTLRRWVREDSRAVVQLVNLWPDYLLNPEVWRAVSADDLWSVAEKARGTRRKVGILTAALNARADLSPEVVVSRWRASPRLIFEALAAVNLDPQDATRWLAALPPKTVAEFVRREEAPAFLLIAALEVLPTSTVAALPAQMIHRLLAEMNLGLASATLLAAALSKTSSRSWGDIAVMALNQVAPIVKKDALGAQRDRFREVEADLPEWDIFARLGRALNRAYKGRAWVITSLLDLRDRDAFFAIIDADAHASLARDLFIAAAEDSASVKGWQNALLAGVIAEKSDRDVLQKTLETMGRIASAVREFLA